MASKDKLNLPAGTVLQDRYEIIKEIGYGGFGTVYKATDNQMGTLKAVKVMRPSMVAEADKEGSDGHIAMMRLQRELGDINPIVGTIQQALTLTETGDIDGVPYVVMDFCEDKTLDEILAGPRLTVERIHTILLSLCAAASALHRKGVAHRDLKPSNIFVSKEGTVTLMDFGIADRITPPEGDRKGKVTKAGYITGTVEYMSDNQAAAGAPIAYDDTRAICAILYEMITSQVLVEPVKMDRAKQLTAYNIECLKRQLSATWLLRRLEKGQKRLGSFYEFLKKGFSGMGNGYTDGATMLRAARRIRLPPPIPNMDEKTSVGIPAMPDEDEPVAVRQHAKSIVLPLASIDMMLQPPDPASTEDTEEEGEEQDVTKAQTNITRLPDEGESDDEDDGLVVTKMSPSTRWAIGIAAAFAIVILLGFVVDSVFLTETPTTAPPAAPKQTQANKAEPPARADIGATKAPEPDKAPAKADSKEEPASKGNKGTARKGAPKKADKSADKADGVSILDVDPKQVVDQINGKGGDNKASIKRPKINTGGDDKAPIKRPKINTGGEDKPARPKIRTGGEDKKPSRPKINTGG